MKTSSVVTLILLYSVAFAVGQSVRTLYAFKPNGLNGAGPQGNLAFDGNGNLYGMTTYGGASLFGTVYELSPSTSGWQQSVIYSFTGSDVA